MEVQFLTMSARMLKNKGRHWVRGSFRLQAATELQLQGAGTSAEAANTTHRSSLQQLPAGCGAGGATIPLHCHCGQKQAFRGAL